MAKLTPGFIKGLKSTNKHRRFSDGDGLSLVVRPNGSKAWQVRIVKDGRKTDRGIGSYPDVKLAEARREAQAKRTAASDGRELEEVTSNVPTFAKPESTEGGRRVSVLRRQEGAPVLLG